MRDTLTIGLTTNDNSSNLRPTTESNTYSWILWHPVHTHIIICCEQRLFQQSTQQRQKMKLELNTEQLELLEFILSEFEYEDDKERTLIEQIEAQIYNVREEDLLRVAKILKAQSQQPTPQWS